MPDEGYRPSVFNLNLHFIDGLEAYEDQAGTVEGKGWRTCHLGTKQNVPSHHLPNVTEVKPWATPFKMFGRWAWTQNLQNTMPTLYHWGMTARLGFWQNNPIIYYHLTPNEVNWTFNIIWTIHNYGKNNRPFTIDSYAIWKQNLIHLYLNEEVT